MRNYVTYLCGYTCISPIRLSSPPSSSVLPSRPTLTDSQNIGKELTNQFGNSILCCTDLLTGASYNVFDSEELLEMSIRSISLSCQYIVVVYQTTSNFGCPCSPDLVPLLHRLVATGELHICLTCDIFTLIYIERTRCC